jgi:hypothetical protein
VKDPVEDVINCINNRGAERCKQMAMAILASLIRPAATVTEKLYRRQMGERYFTSYNAIVGALLIFVACMPSSVYTRGQLDWDRWSLTEWVSAGLGLIWLLWFGFESWKHFEDVKERYAKGVILHTQNYGTDVERTAIFPPARVALLCVGVGAALMVLSVFQLHSQGLVGFSVLLAVSGLISAQARTYEAARFHAMMLDTMDGHIAQTHLANAVAQRLKPAQAEGLIAPLPAYVSNQYRERFAQAISPARVRPIAPAAPAVPTPQPEPVAVG